MLQSKGAGTTAVAYMLSYLRSRSSPSVISSSMSTSFRMAPFSYHHGSRSVSSLAFLYADDSTSSSSSSYSLFGRKHRLNSSRDHRNIRIPSTYRVFSMDAAVLNIPSSLSSNASPESKKVFTKYEKLVRRLYKTNMYHPVKLGLENMERLNEVMGFPLNTLKDVKIVHVTGSNGKGSVCYKVAKSLQGAGLKTGLFVSPHVSSFRERMQVNFEAITEDEVVSMLPKIFKLCERHGIKATFFEITTALAFHFFAKRDVDVIVLEVGLGGRLDSTNVVIPSLSIITSIGLEHTRILGNTLEKIAIEKAGIIKPGIPVLVGPVVPHDIVRTIAEKHEAPFYRVIPDECTGTRIEEVKKDEAIDFDAENTRIAIASLELLRNNGLVEVTDKQIKEGTQQRPPCRFEQGRVIVKNKEVDFVLDVAHNPSALKLLIYKLKQNYPGRKKRVVAGFSSDKDIQKCAKYLISAVNNATDQIHLVEAAHPRAASIETIINAAPILAKSHWKLDDHERSITNQIEPALELAATNDEVLVVCGSVFLMAATREALGFDEARDSDHISEVAGAHLRHSQENFADSNPCPPFTWDEHFSEDDDTE